MKKINRFSFLVICFVLLSVSLVLATPSLNSLNGNIKIITNETELNVDEGLNISAFIDGEVRTSDTIKDNSIYILVISGTTEDDGKEITFKIGNMIADQILIYSSYSDNEVDLTITDFDNDGYSVGYEGYDGENKDCDDTDAEINVKNTYYLDSDSDGYGDDSNTTQACSAPTGYVSDNTDCNDDNAGINPGATDACGNGIDEDCSGADTTCSTSGGSSPSGGSSSCYTEWECTDWSDCIDEEQTRTCEKKKSYCRVREDKPDEVQDCVVQEEETEETETYYRFENNECVLVTIPIETKGLNDYEEEADCIANITTPPTPGFIAGITGAVVGAVGVPGTIIIVFLIGLVALTIIVKISKKRRKIAG